MKITTNYEPTAGTVTVVMAMNEQADPDAMADLGWEAVYRALASAKRQRGTVPGGLRDAPSPST